MFANGGRVRTGLRSVHAMPGLCVYRIALRYLKERRVGFAGSEGGDLSLVKSVTRTIACRQQHNLQVGRRPDLALGDQRLVISLCAEDRKSVV